MPPTKPLPLKIESSKPLRAQPPPASRLSLMLGTMATGGVIGPLVMDWSVAASRLGRWRNTRPDRSMASDCNDIAKVRPARISVTGCRLTHASRNPTSNERSSLTFQIAPARTEYISTVLNSRSYTTSATGRTVQSYGPSKMVPTNKSPRCSRVSAPPRLKWIVPPDHRCETIPTQLTPQPTSSLKPGIRAPNSLATLGPE